MATPQSERHLMWLVTIVAAAAIIVVELTVGPPSLFKIVVCAVALLVIGIALLKRAWNRRRQRT
jgi:hypothetical protein